MDHITNIQPNIQDKNKNIYIFLEAQVFWERHGDPTKRTLEHGKIYKSQQQQHDTVGEDFTSWIKRILLEAINHYKTKFIVKFIFPQQMHT